jgi:hypothetical protein
MSTPSPALADALGMLRNDLCLHLEEAENLANRDSEWSAEDTQTARALIADLVLAIRALLVEHRRQASGDCRVCTSPWPCPVVSGIHAIVKDPERQFVALV